MKTFDAIIIGAGVIGCSIALSLARHGYKTLNVDALPSAGYGSTSHSSAIIRPFYSHEVSCAIAHEARYRWMDWQNYLGNISGPVARYVETGGLVLVRDGTDHLYANNLAALDQVGIEYKLLTAREISAMYPGISLDAFGPPKQTHEAGFGEPVSGRITGGILIPASGYVSDPKLAAGNLHEAAMLLGSTFMFNTRVEDIIVNKTALSNETVSGIRVKGDEVLMAPIVINAAGPHSSVINDLAGISGRLKIKTQPHRHEVAYLKAPPGYRQHAGFIVDLDTGVYQKPDGADMLIGSADPACDSPDIVDPDDYNDQLTDQWTTQVVRAAQRWPELGIENQARGTVGLYDVSDDWIPVYDRTDIQGFYLAIGTSGNQFKNAPVVGDIMTAIIENREHDSEPTRLELAHLGRPVDLSFYSRNRVIQNTSTVLA